MSERRDGELNVKAIVGFAIGLVVVTTLSAVGLWYFSKFLRGYEAAKDPARPVLEAARAPYEPPGPRLQSDPEGELKALRDKEDAILESYAWIDEAGGLAQVPIERAITLMVGDDRPPTLEAQSLTTEAGETEEAEH